MMKRRKVRAILARTFIAAAVVPFLLLCGWGLYHAQGEWRREARRLAEVAVQSQQEMDEHLDGHRIALQTLAEQLRSAGVPMDASVTPWLDVLHRLRPAFLTMIATDDAGGVVAAVPGFVPGLAVSDREYFVRSAGGEPWFVSGAFRGRGFGNAPIVSVAARVEDEHGRFLGIVQGSLAVGRFAQLEERFASMAELRIVVLDHDGAVVYGGRDGRFRSLDRLDEAWLMDEAAARRLVRTDHDGDGRRWVVTSARSPTSGWRVLVMQPFAVAIRDLKVYLVGLVIAAFWSIFIMFLAARRAGRAVQPLEQLAAAMRDFSVAAPHGRFHVPGDAPAEIIDLARSFDAMAERTHLVITGLVPICALCKRIRTEADEWEPVEAFVRARSQAEFTHGMCPDCTETLGFPPTIPPADGHAGRSADATAGSAADSIQPAGDAAD
jgi:hypothetical protein